MGRRHIILTINVKSKSGLCPFYAFLGIFMREYTNINFYLFFNLLQQMCSRTSPAQAEQLLLPDLVPKCFPLIRMISVSVGPGLKCGPTIAFPRS